jgi:hypothetical protein
VNSAFILIYELDPFFTYAIVTLSFLIILEQIAARYRDGGWSPRKRGSQMH